MTIIRYLFEQKSLNLFIYPFLFDLCNIKTTVRITTKVGNQTKVIIGIITKVVGIKVRITISKNMVATKIMHIILDHKTHITVLNLLKLIRITNEVVKVIISNLHTDITTLVEDSIITNKASMVISRTKASNRTI